MKKGSQDEVLKNLVALAKEGDSKAYGKIFRICYKDIYDYIMRRVMNRFDAEDLTMHVFTRGMVAVSSYQERGRPVKAWLFRIAHNTVVDHFRAQSQKAIPGNIRDIPDEANIEEGIIHREKLGDLAGVIRLLPEAQSEVLTLRFLEDMSVTETAMILGKKEVTVRALQFKGIKSMRKRLGVEPGVNGKKRAGEGKEEAKQ